MKDPKSIEDLPEEEQVLLMFDMAVNDMNYALKRLREFYKNN
jgi:uncharacterized protein YutD